MEGGACEVQRLVEDAHRERQPATTCKMEVLAHGCRQFLRRLVIGTYITSGRDGGHYDDQVVREWLGMKLGLAPLPRVRAFRRSLGRRSLLASSKPRHRA